MFGKIFSATFFVLFLLSLSVFAFGIRSVRSWTGETIYIRDDGSIYPNSAPISTLDNITYTVTDDIKTTFGSGIVIERNDTVVDGAHHTLQGEKAFSGIKVTTGRRNVTIMNFKIEDYGEGILVFPTMIINITGNTIGNNVTTHTYGISLYHSSDITIAENNITNSLTGIMLSSSNNSEIFRNELTINHYEGISFYVSNHSRIYENRITTGHGASIGIELAWSVKVNISENTIADNHYGLTIGAESENNTIFRNTIFNNTYGIQLTSSNNTIYHNNFIDSIVYQAWPLFSVNSWDDGCEGNYWSDYNGTDSDGDGIGDTPYVIDENNADRYPLMNLYWNPCDINHDLRVDMRDVGASARAFGTEPGDVRWNCHADITGPIPLEPDGKVDMRDIGLISRNFGQTYS